MYILPDKLATYFLLVGKRQPPPKTPSLPLNTSFFAFLKNSAIFS